MFRRKSINIILNIFLILVIVLSSFYNYNLIGYSEDNMIFTSVNITTNKKSVEMGETVKY